MRCASQSNLVLRGVAASRGRVSGVVRIVLDPNKAQQMEKGEVLVTTMTNPLFVPAMKKAVAIVTDTGGVLCHAAIVSREFGIPCVVGTGQATKKLKDGMEILIDGTHGKVYRR